MHHLPPRLRKCFKMCPPQGRQREGVSLTANWSPPTACSCFLGKRPSAQSVHLPCPSLFLPAMHHTLWGPPSPKRPQFLPHPLTHPYYSSLCFLSFFQTHQPPHKLLLMRQTPQSLPSLVPGKNLLPSCETSPHPPTTQVLSVSCEQGTGVLG